MSNMLAPVAFAAFVALTNRYDYAFFAAGAFSIVCLPLASLTAWVKATISPPSDSAATVRSRGLQAQWCADVAHHAILSVIDRGDPSELRGKRAFDQATAEALARWRLHRWSTGLGPSAGFSSSVLPRSWRCPR
jgi:hypothetical protein